MKHDIRSVMYFWHVMCHYLIHSFADVDAVSGLSEIVLLVGRVAGRRSSCQTKAQDA